MSAEVRTVETNSKLLIAENFNFYATTDYFTLKVGYKHYTAWYNALFELPIDQLENLIDVLSALKSELEKSNANF